VIVPPAGCAAEAAHWERALRRVGTAARAATEKAYLKSDLEFAGAGIPAIRAILALLRPLRAGGGDFERFARYADAMLDEKEFFVRKAIGWVLRDVAKRRPELVAAWLAPRLHRASGVTVREAVKPLPGHVCFALLAGYRDRRAVRCDHEDKVITGWTG